MLALASVALVQPAPSTAQNQRGKLLIRLVDHYANVGRRDLNRAAALRLSVGVAQTTLGTYGMVTRRYTPAIRRSAIAITGFGLSGVGFGLFALVQPSSLERLARSDELEDLRAAPEDASLRARAERQWAEAAERARRWRIIIGSGYLTAGVGLLSVGAVFAFSPVRVVSDDEKFWAFSTVATGLGATLTGALGLVIRSPAERSLSTYDAVVGAKDRRLSVRPSPGGVVVSGRF